MCWRMNSYLQRTINANFRLGNPGNAEALADFASRPDSPEAMRVAALDALGDWAKPEQIDRVMGLWRPLLLPPNFNAPPQAMRCTSPNF